MNLLGMGDVFGAGKESWVNILGLPEQVITIAKYLIYGLAAIIALFALVWLIRFAKGNGPDVMGAAERAAGIAKGVMVPF